MAAAEGEDDALPVEGDDADAIVMDEESDDDDPQLQLGADPNHARLAGVRAVVQQRLVDFFALEAAEQEMQEMQDGGHSDADEMISDESEDEGHGQPQGLLAH